MDTSVSRSTKRLISLSQLIPASLNMSLLSPQTGWRYEKLECCEANRIFTTIQNHERPINSLFKLLIRDLQVSEVFLPNPAVDHICAAGCSSIARVIAQSL